MAKLGGNRMWAEVSEPRDGTGRRDEPPPERYCALCGRAVTASEAAIERFGEPFCSEAHAEEFVTDVRAARVDAAAIGLAPAETQPSERATEAPATQQSWKGLLKMGLCCGAPLLVLLVLAGGGGAVLGAAGAILPFLAFLACPLGMYFMMRSMSKKGQQGDRGDRGGEK